MSNISPKKKLLLTGATGFIGSYLLPRLTADYQVTALVSPADIGQRPLPKAAQIIYGDLTEFDKIKSLTQKLQPQIIIHIGAITPVRFSFEHPEIYQEVNYLATINLTEAARTVSQFEKFIFASTMETYGWQAVQKPFDEHCPLNPDSPYAASKVAAEKYLQMASRAFDFPCIIMKACNTFGRKDETGYIVEYLVTSMLKNQSPQIGTPEAVRDLLYVDDHVNAYLKALKWPLPPSGQRKKQLKKDPQAFTFNFGQGIEITVLELAQKIKKLTGFKGPIKTGFPADYPWRPATAPYLSLNAAKSRKILGWKPQTSLDEALKKTVRYWEKTLNKNL